MLKGTVPYGMGSRPGVAMTHSPTKKTAGFAAVQLI